MFVFIHNMPGCLPEGDPEVYSTWADAKQAAIDYMDREGDFYAEYNEDGAPEQAYADALSGHMEDLNLNNGPEWGITVGNVAYSITRVDAGSLNENILTRRSTSVHVTDDDEYDKVMTFAWPGGYRVWYITNDSAVLCAECVQAELVQCVDPDTHEWYVEGHYTEADVDEAGPCDNCGRTSDVGNDE